MVNDKKQRRFLIAVIFYLIAIGLALVEANFLATEQWNFFSIVSQPIIYAIYYIMISTTIEDCKIWPLVILFVVFLLYNFIFVGPENLICEILELILFITQILTVLSLYFRDAKKKKS